MYYLHSIIGKSRIPFSMSWGETLRNIQSKEGSTNWTGICDTQQKVPYVGPNLYAEIFGKMNCKI